MTETSTMEKRAKRRAARRDLSRAILGIAKVSGIIAVALVAPNMPSALKKLGMLPTGRKDSSAIARARDRLVREGYLSRSASGLRLTPKGEAKLMRMEAMSDGLPRRKRWDKRWRVLIFDIPERKKSMRERLRCSLLSAGFVKLQDSVWAYPDDCEEFVTLLKSELRIGRELLYLIVEEMEGDAWLRARFGIGS